MTIRTPEQYDWAQLEFNERLLTKHFTPLASRTIRGFTVHHMTIVGSSYQDALDDCYDTWQSREASAHYGVAGPLVTQFVYDKDYAWATGSAKGNLDTISVEHRNSTAGPKWLVDNATVMTGARLIANGHVLYKLGRPVDKKTLFQHDNWYATACPGPFLGGTQWAAYVAETQRVYDELVGAVTPVDPKPAVHTAAWGDPESWVLGAVGPDVTRLGERIRVWWAHFGWGDPYEVGPGEPYGPADVKGLQRLQVKWGYGDAPEDLALGGASDGYPGLQSFDKLASTPPSVEPTPPSRTRTIKLLFLPMAGYNADGARGVTQWKRNTDGLAALVNKHQPDFVATTELSNRDINPMLPRFTTAISRLFAREPGGTDGRYWFRKRSTTDHVASGNVLASNASELDDDDKQGAWTVSRVGDLTIEGIVAHTENQDGIDKSGANKGANADDLRVTQSLSILGRAISAGAEHEPDVVIYVGDFNSEQMVRDALTARGWKAFGPGYFTRWDDSAKKSFDWVFVKEGVVTVERINHDYGDHTALLITWTVTE